MSQKRYLTILQVMYLICSGVRIYSIPPVSTKVLNEYELKVRIQRRALSIMYPDLDYKDALTNFSIQKLSLSAGLLTLVQSITYTIKSLKPKWPSPKK